MKTKQQLILEHKQDMLILQKEEIQRKIKNLVTLEQDLTKKIERLSIEINKISKSKVDSEPEATDSLSNKKVFADIE